MGSLFFSAGLLTVDTVRLNENSVLEYTLKVPNLEVKDHILPAFLERMVPGLSLANVDRIRTAVQQDDIEKLLDLLNSALCTVPYPTFGKSGMHEYEAYYHSAWHLLLWNAIDGDTAAFISEGVSGAGRLDIYLRTSKSQYIIELKLDTDDTKGFQQMSERQYHVGFPPVRPGTPMYFVGCVFSSSTGSLKFKPKMRPAELPNGINTIACSVAEMNT